MKIVSWNINGLNAILAKNFNAIFKNMNADFFCIQETKIQKDSLNFEIPEYYSFWNSAERKGYSGTAVFAKEKPLNVIYGMNDFDNEGRIITLEYESFYLVNVYVPNSQANLIRLNYRLNWGDKFREYIEDLQYIKPIILCGDFNVAHTELDLKYPEKNFENEGFTNEERMQFDELLHIGLVDAYRYLYPNRKEAFTWWSYRNKGRIHGNGWRLDYFLVSNELKDKIFRVLPRQDIGGSDHCPIVMKIRI